MIKTTWISLILPDTVITIESEKGSAIAPYTVSGVAANIISSKLLQSFDSVGHPLGDQCDPWEMNWALQTEKLKYFSFQVVEGESAIVKPAPLPEGAVS